MVVLFNGMAFLFLRPVYATPDGVGYLAYLPSIFHYGTLSFEATYRAASIGIPWALTSTGWIANPWVFGASFLWLPFYKVGYWLSAVPPTLPAPVWGGYFLSVVNFSSMLFGAAAVFLTTTALPAYFHLRVRILIALACFFGTPLFYYSFIEGTSAHAASAFANSLYVWFWIKTSGTDSSRFSPWRWWMLGWLAGLCMMVRPQDVLVALPLIFEGWMGWKRHGRPAKQTALCMAVFGIGFIIGFFPQTLLFRLLEGGWLQFPQRFNLAWSNAAPVACLFSPYHGLLVWTPLYALAFFGLLFCVPKMEGRMRIYGAVLLGQWIVCSFCAFWWEGSSFSLRMMTGTYPLAAFGLAFFFERVSRRSLPPLFLCSIWVFLCLLVIWSTLLALQGFSGALNLYRPLTFSMLLDGAASWKNGLEGVYNQLTRWGRIPFSIVIRMLVLELLIGGWLYGLWKHSQNPSSLRLSRLVLWFSVTWGVLGAYALFMIVFARNGVRPQINSAQALTSKQLEDVFLAESYSLKADYYLQRNQLDKARHFQEKMKKLHNKVSPPS